MNRIGPKLHPDRPKVITFGGGKGGAGRSTMCAEVARSFARQKQRVLCLDASWSCPTLNVLLHADQPQFDFDASSPPPLGEEDSHIADFIIETERDNIWLASVAAARQFPFVRPRLGADVLISQLHELDFDWVLIDLAPGLDPFQVGLFTLSDIPIVLCTPEPASIRMSTQYLRSAFYQAIGYHPEAPEARDEILEMLYEQPLQMNLDSLLEGAADSEKSREVVLDTGRHFDTYLVVNLVREGSERDLGFVLAHAWHRELNIFPRVLASIDYEDRRWFYNRRSSGLGAGRGDEAFSRDTEKLAKNLLDIAVVDARYPRPVPRGDNVHPALRIGFSKDTVQNEARQRCRRLWEGYRREESLSLVFSDPEERMRAASELEKLYREVLTMSSEDFESGVGVSIQPDEEDDSMHEKRAASSTKADSTPDSTVEPESSSIRRVP
ncbi:MAG: MinD/ParA family ATP-binding protein, partial [Persicimonas sp.]